MTSAQAALVDAELIRALNELRIRHMGTWEPSLGQIKFRAQGLKRHPAEFLAMQAMVAVLDGDEETARNAAAAIAKHPADFDCQLNVLRSLSALNMRSEAAEFARRFCADFPSWHSINVGTACLCNAGAIDDAYHLISAWMDHVAAMPSDDVEKARVFESYHMLGDLLNSGITADDFSELLLTCRSQLATEGWPSAGIAVTPIVNGGGEDPPFAVVEFFIDAGDDYDRVLAIEDRVMDVLVANALFSELRVVVAVVPQLATEE